MNKVGQIKQVARVYRFNDDVAISILGNETQYITADQAEELARALQRFSRDILAYEFHESQLGTANIMTHKGVE